MTTSFDEVSQDWLVGFGKHRIGDPRIIRLIQKWLRAGILEDGVVTVSDKGTGAPDNITLLYLAPYSPELNPKENLGDEIREKRFKNYALKSIDAVRAKLKQAILCIERNPKLVRSTTAFPYIVNSL